MADAAAPEPGKSHDNNPSSAPKPLVLRRRRGLTHSPFEVSETASAARETIRAVVEATRSPFSGRPPLGRAQASELERSLRQLEASLAERERTVADLEVRLADRERELAETEALLIAREQLLAASRKAAPAKAMVSKEEQAALEKLRAELERQETVLKEERQGMREREQFLDDSETKLFEKVQAQQEKETELEQREEDLRNRIKEFKEKMAAVDPAAAAALKAEAKQAQAVKNAQDEFNE
jgi:chromosome segregation ATPase